MKQKQFIYDGVIVRAGACLEKFVNENLKRLGYSENDNTSFAIKVEKIIKQYESENQEKIAMLMKNIWKARNKVAHLQKGKNPINPHLDYKEFQKIRNYYIELDNILAKTNTGVSNMSKIMLASEGDLPYTMGNAGDLIKHCALIIFLNWFPDNHNNPRFADPFGGLPWSPLANGEIRRRLNSNVKNVNIVTKEIWDGNDIYYGSGQIALNKNAEVWVSDKCPHKRSDLKASGLQLLNDQFPNYDNQNGYCILKSEYAEKFDLILIDPFSDFLINHLQELDNIKKIVTEFPNLFVMVFILDLQSKNKPQRSDRIYDGIHHTHQRYLEKREELREVSCSIRCPKIEDKYNIKGESKYEMELLIISSKMKDINTYELRQNLKNFAELLTTVLPLGNNEKVEFWPQ